jgi:hypothetical protein
MNRSIETKSGSRLNKLVCMLALFGSACAAQPIDPAELAELEKQGPYVEDAPADAAEVAGDDAAEAAEDVGVTEQALGTDSAAMAWVWASQPTTASYTPMAAYSFNVQGGVNTIRRLGLGRYRVDMPRMATPKGGNAQVVAYGAGAARCNLNRTPYASGSSIRIEVNCFDGYSQPVDTYFVAFYHNEGDIRGRVAAGTYNPDVAQLRQPGNMYLTTSRLSTGRYRMTMDSSMSSLGQAFVSAVGYGASTFCNPSAYNPASFEIRCFNAAGGSVDSEVSFSYFYKPKFYDVNAMIVRGNSTSAHSPNAFHTHTEQYESAWMDRWGTGSYGFTFYEPKFKAYPAPTTALVTANMPSAIHCKNTGWGFDIDFSMGVACYDYRGVAVNAWIGAAAFGYYSYGAVLLPL